MSKRDMRRADLVVPYVEPKKDEKPTSDFASTFTSSMPMATMYTRNKLLGWTTLVVAILNWTSESPDQTTQNATPGYVGVVTSFVAVLVTYFPLFFPPQANAKGGVSTGTEAPSAVPP